MKTEREAWNELRVASTPRLPPDFAARAIERALLHKRRTRAARRVAAVAAFCTLGAIAAVSMLVNFGAPRDLARRSASGPVKRAAVAQEAPSMNASDQAGTADTVISSALTGLMFPAADSSADSGAAVGASPDEWSDAAACVPNDDGFVCLSPTDGYFQVASN